MIVEVISVIRSMTGYGREQRIIGEREITVEIRSVNHRYFEFSARVPRIYGYIEEKLKAMLKENISRGKVEVNVQLNMLGGKSVNVTVDMDTAYEYIKALREANEELALEDDLTLSRLMKFPDIFTVQKQEDDEEQIWKDISSVVSAALERFVSMRETEGASLKEDILSKLVNIEGYLEKVEAAAPQTAVRYREKLMARLREILEDKNVDEQRVITEAAVFAEKIAIDEETVRLRSHISQFRTLLDSDVPIGRKLDFLVQEVNREINTIGSKAQDVEITKCVVEMKSETEKIREQIQNIE